MGTEYYGVDSYPVDVFFFDYFRSTVIALAICVFFEFFIFKKKNLTHKFYFDLQNALISKLDGLFCIVTRNPIRQSQYLKISAQLNVNILELNTFFITVQHDYHIAAYHFRDLDTFNRLVEQTYQNIRQLFVIGTESPANLTAETRVMLDQLFELSQEQRQGDVMCSPHSSA
jgi:hypothetical protein